MTISSATAKQLCTKPELVLFNESLARNVKSLSARTLQNRIVRSRKLRDKYKQLAHRQDREARSKQRPRGARPSQGSAATRQKEQLFSESLTRFEKQLARAKATEAKTRRKEVKATRKPTTKKKATKKAATKKKVSPGKKTASTKKATVKKATPKPKVKRKVATKKKVVPRRSARKKIATTKKTARMSSASKKATPKAKRAKFTASGLMRKQKHGSATNRRRQARRDSGR